ncbi:MAG: glycosyltransferase family 2 protein [Candidatus Paceibacterota bacterium]|jgi:glycosyltransferase involved in cell wall biosynthesis
MKSAEPTLGIIVPCYDEEAALNDSAERLTAEIKKLKDTGVISAKSFVAFVDDGSKDATWEIISGLTKKDNNIRGLKLAGNVGHQNALLAGLMSFRSEADCLISIDADLQDSIDVMGEMVKGYVGGAEIVYGVRSERTADSFFKRFTAESYYKLLALFGVKIVYNHADYRLLGSRALATLEGYGEVNLFLRGLVPLLGFRSITVTYERQERRFGSTKYPLRKMLRLAFDGITSFSSVPLRAVTLSGFAIFLASLVMSAYVIIGYILHNVVAGWASIVLPMYLLGGIQLLAIGIIGEYLAKIYTEVKRRPRYTVEEKI